MISDVLENPTALCRQHAFQTLADFASHVFREIARLRLRGVFLPLPKGSKQTDVENLYTLGEKIGEGTFGKVFACKDLSWFAPRGPLCMKVVPLNGRHVPRITRLSEDDMRTFFTVLADLRHPGIIRFHRCVQTDDTLYTVMERCCGPNLSDRLGPEGGLAAAEVQGLARQMLSSLEALHAAKLMHRDVKLDNFRFADETCHVLKLLDFGFCKATSGLPANHTVTGTLLYAAPEVFDGMYCHSCDVWSTGIVLFQLFSGLLPFQTSDVLILRSMHKDPVLLGDSLFRGKVWNEVPSEGQGLIRCLLTRDPSKRPSAANASQHRWLLPPNQQGQLPALLRRVGSSLNEFGSHLDLTPLLQRSTEQLKRSTFAMNLAEAGGHSDSSGCLSRHAVEGS